MAGINATLYNNDKREQFISQEELMSILHIKDSRTIKRLIIKESIPYLKVNGKFLIKESDYNKWISNSMRIG